MRQLKSAMIALASWAAFCGHAAAISYTGEPFRLVSAEIEQVNGYCLVTFAAPNGEIGYNEQDDSIIENDILITSIDRFAIGVFEPDTDLTDPGISGIEDAAGDEILQASEVEINTTVIDPSISMAFDLAAIVDVKVAIIERGESGQSGFGGFPTSFGAGVIQTACENAGTADIELPLANAGPDLVVPYADDALVTGLDGSGSSDDQTPTDELDYTWTLQPTDGIAGSDLFGIKPTFRPSDYGIGPEGGELVFLLVVEDGQSNPSEPIDTGGDSDSFVRVVIEGDAIVDDTIGDDTVVDDSAPTVEVGAFALRALGTVYSSTIILSEAAGDTNPFDMSDLIVENGTVQSLEQISATEFEAVIDPVRSGEIMTLRVGSGAFENEAGNPNVASNVVSQFIHPMSETTGLIAGSMGAGGLIVSQTQPNSERRVDRVRGSTPRTGAVALFGLSMENSMLPFSARVGRDRASFSTSLSAMTARREGAPTVRFDPVEALNALGVSAYRAPDPRRDANRYMPLNDGSSDTGSDMVFALQSPNEGSGEEGSAPSTLAVDSTGRVAAERFGAPAQNRFDIWAEGYFGIYDNGGGEGDFAIVHFGADYLVTPDVLIGLGAQLDWIAYEELDSVANAQSFGFMIGPYLTAEITDQLYVDARAAWGQSDYDLSPLGNYTDEAGAERYLVSGALIGDFDVGGATIAPEVRLTYYREALDSYTDTFGVDIPSHHVSTGVLEFGPTLSRDYALDNGTTLTPSFTLEGIWTFANENTALEAAGLEDDFVGEGLRARVQGGLEMITENGFRFGISAAYDGIGEAKYEALSGSLSVSKRW